MVDVLLVDQRPLVRQLVADMLEEAGLQVLAAVGDVAAAREFIARRDVPPPAVLIAALVRSGSGGDALHGRTLAAALRQQLSRNDDGTGPHLLGVIYIGEHAPVLGGNALGPSEQVLHEPFGRDALVRAVFGVVEREVPRWLAGRKRVRPAMHA